MLFRSLPRRSPAFGPVAELLLGPVDHFFRALLLRRYPLLVVRQVDLVLFVVQLQLHVVLRHGRMLRSRMPATPEARTGQLELSLRVKRSSPDRVWLRPTGRRPDRALRGRGTPVKSPGFEIGRASCWESVCEYV